MNGPFPRYAFVLLLLAGCQGNSTPVKVPLQADPNVQAKFWRVRVR